MDVPWKKLPADVRDMILHGSKEREIKWKWKSEKGEYVWSSSYKGLVPLLMEKYKEVESEDARQELEKFMSATPCPDCGGRRLKAEALAVKVRGQALDALTSMTLEDAKGFFATFAAEPREREIAGKILKEIEDRLGFLNDVGIGESGRPATGTGVFEVSPDPVRDRATVTFAVSRPGPVSLELLDAAGRTEARLFAGTLDKGKHSVNWRTARQLAAGTHYLRLSSGGATRTREVLVVN